MTKHTKIDLGAAAPAFEQKNGNPGSPDDVKTIIANLGRAFEEFRTRNDKELAEVKAGMKAAPADLDKLQTALSDLQEAKDKIELSLKAQAKKHEEELIALEAKLNRPGARGNNGPEIDFEAEAEKMTNHVLSMKRAHNLPIPTETFNVDSVKAYKSAMLKAMRRGIQSLNGDEQKALLAGSDPDGGFLITPDVSGRIVTRVYETSPIRQLVSQVTISTDALEGVNDFEEAGGLVMVGEQTAPTETTTPKIGKWRIAVHEGYVEPKATQQLLEDSSVDMEAWLARKVADKISRGQNNLFINGNGVGRPMGLFAYTTAETSDDTRAWGVFEHVKTGVNGNFATSNPADVFFDLIGKFKDFYLANARFFTRREVVTLVRKFKESTTGQYLWQPGLQVGQPQTILTYPVVIGQDIPGLGTNGNSLAFGDFAEAYTIVDRLGMTTIRDNLTAKPFIKFYTRVRFGGGALNFEAVKFIRFAA